MGFLDRLRGTKYPEDGVSPLPAQELRAALLALNGTGVPFRIRQAFGAEKADLVAEWQVVVPYSGDMLSAKNVERTMKARMRFAPVRREVHVLDEVREVALVGNPPRRGLSRQWSRGPSVQRQWTYERGPDGRRHKVVLFDSRDMRDPLRNTVLGAGWIWRGVFRL
ncbi:hypothetical protein AB0L75_06930 [Streptomyces sp. NPDC052101]|uniref:hypothetical protein n=1 Tax=Streptomyces sp. NPDC052101 TaxID=3155763 RepID=UPI00342110A1